jgi:rhodanese-related sulfurtransferase
VEHTRILAGAFLLAVFGGARGVLATDYYVSNAGSDGNTGLTPSAAWQTIAHVNSRSFLPGDSVLFRRGDVWRETLSIHSSGTAEAWLTLGAYGTGTRPRILGSERASGWTQVAPNIWRSSTSLSNPYAGGYSYGEVYFEGLDGVTRWGDQRSYDAAPPSGTLSSRVVRDGRLGRFWCAGLRRRSESKTLSSYRLDVRPYLAWGAGHVPGSINIGLDGQFASWAGSLIAADRDVVVVAEDEAGVRQAAVRLARVGLERVAGRLDGGVAAWDRSGREVAILDQMPVDELRRRVQEEPGRIQVVDVRRPGEYAAGHVPGALPRPLDRLQRQIEGLDPSKPTAVICAGGYRSSAATGLLRRLGFAELANVVGGTSAWVASGHPVEAAG